MAFNWRKYEAWRKHPMLQPRFSSTVPGLGLGVALFGVYMVAETAMNAAGGNKANKGH